MVGHPVIGGTPCVLVGHPAYWWDTLYIVGTPFILVGHPAYWWDTLYIGGTPCILVGHSVYWWDTLYIGGTPFILVRHPVHWWDTLFISETACILVGHPCILVGHLVYWWDTLHIGGTPCILVDENWMKIIGHPVSYRKLPWCAKRWREKGNLQKKTLYVNTTVRKSLLSLFHIFCSLRLDTLFSVSLIFKRKEINIVFLLDIEFAKTF